MCHEVCEGLSKPLHMILTAGQRGAVVLMELELENESEVAIEERFDHLLSFWWSDLVSMI